MSNVYSQRSSAVRAAKAACGPDQEWVIVPNEEGFTFTLLNENEKQPVSKVAAKHTQPAPTARAPKVVSKGAETAAEAPRVSKMALATEIYDRMTKAGNARKDILLAFIAEAGLTKAGASTYHQSIKSKK